jgi:ADP-ribose pyrophosphatase YjhB (NUDIX family)
MLFLAMQVTTPRFCQLCAGALVERLVQSEQRIRPVCGQCGAIAYRNPQVLVSTVVGVEDRVLLCQRAYAPAAHRWGLPGGFLECGETLEEAAARETFEETGVRLSPGALRLHALSTLPEIGEVYVGFVAALPAASPLVCGPECLDVRFFAEAEMPWDELTYPDVGAYLRLYFRERQNAESGVHFCRLNSTETLRHTYQIAGSFEVRTARVHAFGKADPSELPLTAAEAEPPDRPR